MKNFEKFAVFCHFLENPTVFLGKTFYFPFFHTYSIIKIMYNREYSELPEKLIIDGKPQFGTYKSSPQKLDIKYVKDPFNTLPLPSFFTNLRIRANITYTLNTEEFVGSVMFFDSKVFCYIEIILWEKATKKKYSYRTFFGFKRLVPKNLEKATCGNFRKNRYIKITWDKSKEKFTLVFNAKGDEARPSFAATFKRNGTLFGELTSVVPSPTKRRCTASYCNFFPISAALTKTATKYQDFSETKYQNQGLCFFDIRRAYYKLRTKETFLIGIGFIDEKPFAFRLATSNHDAIDKDTYNENLLFIDNETTLLPPVTITQPFGISKKWIIQDTENMIDLTFHPISDNKRIASIFILRTEYHTIYGSFEGDLSSKDGTIYHIKDLLGIGSKCSLRM